MMWLCKIGIHDWETIESKQNYQIEHNIFLDNNPDIDPKRPCYRSTMSGEGYYKNKICLNCGKQINEIEKHKNELVAAIKLNNQRQTKAKKLCEAI